MQKSVVDGESTSPEIGMSVVRGFLLVPIQMELRDDTVLAVQESILKKIEATTVKGAVIDLSAVRVLDTFAFEAFANTYCNFADTVRAKLTRTKPDPLVLDFPNVDDGLRGMLFIDTVLTSTKSKKKWVAFKK